MTTLYVVTGWTPQKRVAVNNKRMVRYYKQQEEKAAEKAKKEVARAVMEQTKAAADQKALPYPTEDVTCREGQAQPWEPTPV